MTKDLIIQDTAQVFFKSLVTGNVIGVGYAQVAGLEGTTEETDLRGGVNNKLAYVLRSSKDLSLNVTSATFKPEFFALMQGTEIQDGVTAEITKNVFVKVTENATTPTDLELVLPTELSSLTTVRVEDVDGEQQDLAVTSGIVTLPTGFDAVAGDELEVFYLESVTGKSVEMRTDKHPSKVRVEYQTICYDRETATVHSDIYFIFDEAIPSGNFSMSLQNGEAYIPEFNLRVTPPKGSNVLGRKLEVVRP